MSAIAPAILMATTRDAGGTVWSLAIVRTHYKNEGSAVLEAVNGTTGELLCVDYATWRIQQSDAGPATLSAELPDYPGTIESWEPIKTALLQGLLDRGASWGIDAIEP